jgi:butyrate kinase
VPTQTSILAINPGSTSTRLALFKCAEPIELLSVVNVKHPTEEIKQFAGIIDQYEYRLQSAEAFLASNGSFNLAAVVGRGGLLKSIASGTYLVNDAMVSDLKQGIQGQHASNLGGLLAKGIADPRKIPAFIVDPVSVDEFTPIARLSGLPQVKRVSLGHSLNVRAVARRVATSFGKQLSEVNFVVAHLGGGISVAPVERGHLLDYNDANQAGPFSPERAGSLPAADVVTLAFSGKYTLAEIRKLFNGQAGLVGYLGSNDARQAVERAEAGDSKAALVLDAMAFQIAKEIGAMATVLSGRVDGIILTGGLAYAAYLTSRITDYVNYIAPVYVEPGEDEMKALAEGAWLVLSGREPIAEYR